MRRHDRHCVRAFARAQFLLPLLAALACSPAAEIEVEDAPTAKPVAEPVAGLARPERIFLFVVDTLRRDHLSAYGSAVSTPHIDGLASRGQRFDEALASFHQTTMSMGALFTGRTPAIESTDPRRRLPWTGHSWCGLSRFAEGDDDSCVPASLPTLAARIRDAGYWTAGVVSNELLFDPAGYSRGFDRWEQVGGDAPPGRRKLGARLRRGDVVNARAIEVLDARPSDRFLLYVHWMDVHDHGLLDPSYGAAVARFDGLFGAFLDAIEERGLAEDAWFVFTADHGESLNEKTALGVAHSHNGNPSYEPQLRIPLIAVPALAVDAERPIRSQDLSTLLLTALGLEPLAPQPQLDPGELFLSESLYHTLRRDGFKSARRRSNGETALFDLETDPGETRNVASDHPDVVASHAARVLELHRRFENTSFVPKEVSPEDLAKLRALGYID